MFSFCCAAVERHSANSSSDRPSARASLWAWERVVERSDRDVMGRGEEGGVEGGGCLCRTDDIGPRAVIQHVHCVQTGTGDQTVR